MALSRDLGVDYKTSFVLTHKLREAMAEEMKGRVVGGVGKEAEVDAGWFGGYQKPANLKVERRDRRLVANQNGKRQAVIIIRERGGNSVPAVFRSESAALGFVKARIAKGTVLHADASPSWDDLHANFEMKRIDHSKAYSFDGACTNMAEEYFSRLRRAEAGHHHHIAGSTFSAMRRKRHGARITAACRTVTSSAASPSWRRRRRPRRTSWDTGMSAA